MKWEYLVKFYDGSRDGIVFMQDLEEYFNKMGAKGWELVQCDYEEYQVVFKRRIEINEKLRAAQQKEVPNNDDKNGSSEAAGGIQE